MRGKRGSCRNLFARCGCGHHCALQTCHRLRTSGFGTGRCPIPFAIFPFPVYSCRVSLHTYFPCALYPVGSLPPTAVLLPQDWNKHPLQASEVPPPMPRTCSKGFVPCSTSWAFQSHSSAIGMPEILSDINDSRSHKETASKPSQGVISTTACGVWLPVVDNEVDLWMQLRRAPVYL